MMESDIIRRTSFVTFNIISNGNVKFCMHKQISSSSSYSSFLMLCVNLVDGFEAESDNFERILRIVMGSLV